MELKKTIIQYLRNISEIIIEFSQDLYKKQRKWNMWICGGWRVTGTCFL
jgi:hypothetical protein